MKVILDFLSKIIIKDSKLLLGRWSISYCPNNITKRVDSGNEDHCGPCGQYDLKNNIIKTENKKKVIANKIIKDIE